ncbi:MAG: hypothetical protein QXF35_02020 [Candidatus Bilamarchaeaceae archaeon]
MANAFVLEYKKIVVKCEKVKNNSFKIKAERLLQYESIDFFQGYFDFKKILAIKINNDGETLCIKKSDDEFRAYACKSIKSIFVNKQIEKRSFLPFIKKEIVIEDIRG